MTRKKKRIDDDFRLEDVLAVFRGLETNEDALVVLGDAAAMKVLVAWSHLDQVWIRPDAPPPDAIIGKLGRLWKWIVSGWDIDAMEVSRLAGVTQQVAHAKIEQLVGNRLVYPDGSIAKSVHTALLAYAANQLGLKHKQPPPEKPDKKRAGPKIDIDDESN